MGGGVKGCIQNWLSIITGTGRALDMGAYTALTNQWKREHHHMPRHMRHPGADLVAFLGSTPDREAGEGIPFQKN